MERKHLLSWDNFLRVTIPFSYDLNSYLKPDVTENVTENVTEKKHDR